MDFTYTRPTQADEEFRKAAKNSALPDYYKILDVPRDASQYEIKKRYRELAKKLHPDKSKEEKPDEIMQKIKRAYKNLYNTEIKKKYDQHLNVS